MPDERLMAFYRTLGEDRDITAESVGMVLQRAIALTLCRHTTHFPKPCLQCIELVRPMTKPIGRALKHAAMFERKGLDREAGYVALSQSIDVLAAEDKKKG